MAFGVRELTLDFLNPSQRQRIGFKQRHTYRLLESGDQPNLIAGNLLFVAGGRLGDLHGPPVPLQPADSHAESCARCAYGRRDPSCNLHAVNGMASTDDAASVGGLFLRSEEQQVTARRAALHLSQTGATCGAIF
jgi:hypothetical protein